MRKVETRMDGNGFSDGRRSSALICFMTVWLTCSPNTKANHGKGQNPDGSDRGRTGHSRITLKSPESGAVSISGAGPLSSKDYGTWLRARWNRLRPIRSAAIRYRRFVQPGNGRMTSGQLQEFLSRGPFATDADRFRELFQQGIRKLSHDEDAWSLTRFYFDRGCMRENNSLFDQVYDGETEIIVDRNNRFIRLYTPGEGEPRSSAIPLEQLRYVPPDQLLDSGWQLKSRSGSGSIIRFMDGREMLIAAGTGVILKQLQRTESGEITRMFQQLEWETSDDGTLYPAIVIDASFRQNRLVRLVAIRIDDATFNEELPPETFTVSAEAGDLIRDRRTAQWTDYAPRVPVPDVMAVLGTSSSARSREIQWHHRRFYWVGGISLLIVLLIVIWLGRFNSQRAS